MRKKTHRSFEEARKFVRTLGLKNEKGDWRKYSKSGKRPDDIPTNPYNTYKKEWVSWPDFLGSDKTNPRSVPKKDEWSYKKAKAFLKKLGVKDKEDFFRLKKLGKIPKKIPAASARIYRNKGWEGWGNFLGTGRIANQDKIYKTFEEAREFVRSLGLKNGGEWDEYLKSDNLPADIPNVPRVVYKKEWKSMGDWIGTDYIANRYRTFWSYEKAKAFVIKQGITGYNEFRKAKSEKKLPDDIPSNPNLEYEKEWEDWGIFLGTGRIANRDKVFWSYNKAKTFLKKIGVAGRDDFYQLSKEGKIPKEIPRNANTYYKKEWIGWFDFLGNKDVRVTLENLRSFVKSFIESGVINENSHPGLLVSLMRRNKNLNLHKNWNRKIVRAIATLSQDPEGRKTLREFAMGKTDAGFGKLEAKIEELPDDPETKEKIIVEQTDNRKKPDYLSNKKQESTSKLFEEADVFESISVDDEAKKFYERFFVNGIWINCFAGDREEAESVSLANKEKNHKNEFRRKIANIFLEEYEGTKNLKIPSIIAKNKTTGKPIRPWLSQLFTAYKIKTEPHFANFNGTGAGKTLAAIIASKAIDAKITVVVCPNAILDQWGDEAEKCFADNVTISGKDAFYEKYDKNKSKFLIINWDKLNQNDSEDWVRTLAEQQIDLFVLDEIHFSKNPKSTRFTNLGALLSEARKKNQNLKVLAMTATPIVNDLAEGKTQLQLITGKKYNDLKTTPYTDNAIALWEKFTGIDIRHKPEYANVIFDEVDVFAKTPTKRELQHLTSNPLAIEQFLTDARMKEIIKRINGPTIIYSDYVGAVKGLPGHKAITQKLASAVQKAGYEFGFYTGSDKNGLNDFIDKKIDVLIASNPLSVGVDKLQFRCKNLIFNALPWTNARYRQIIGRIARPGLIGERTITVHHIRGRFLGTSYDLKRKLANIENKRRLADCAIDGENLPEGKLPSHEAAIRSTLDWLKRLQRGEISIIEREAFTVKLPEGEIKKRLLKFGSIDKMNQKFGQSDSRTIFKFAQKDPTFLEQYTRAQMESEKHLTINPTDYLIQKLKEMRQDYKIGDMGCGLQNKIWKTFGSRVKSFDIGTYDFDELIPCDIADISKHVKNGELDLVIYSQSLMTRNWREILKEGARCLKKYGYLFVVVQTQQWRKRIDQLFDEISESGFEIIGDPKKKGEFTFIEAVKTRKKRL